jgi:hypothetical protein
MEICSNTAPMGDGLAMGYNPAVDYGSAPPTENGFSRKMYFFA